MQLEVWANQRLLLAPIKLWVGTSTLRISGTQEWLIPVMKYRAQENVWLQQRLHETLHSRNQGSSSSKTAGVFAEASQKSYFK